MSRASITKRWLLNSVGVISVFFFVACVILTVFIRNYYYSSARQYMNARMNNLTGLIQGYYRDSSTGFSNEIRSMVTGFSDKSKLELMAVGNDGRISITSSGFIPDRKSVV